MSNEWDDLMGVKPSTPPKTTEAPAPIEPPPHGDSDALFSAETHQAVRDGTEKAKAATKAAAVGAASRVKRLAHVIRLRVSTARLERVNRRLERQTEHVESTTAPRVAKTWIYSALGVALIGGLGGGAWLYLRKPDGAPAAQTHAQATPAPAPVVGPLPVEPMADPIADLDEPTPQATPQPMAPAPEAKPQPVAPAPQAKATATATEVEVAKPLPPKPRPKAAPAKRDTWNSNQANKQLDEFFNQH